MFIPHWKLELLDELNNDFRVTIDWVDFSKFATEFPVRRIHVKDLPRGTHGLYLIQEKEIYISKSTLKFQQQRAYRALMHELIHAYEHERELSIPHAMVRAAARIMIG